MPGQFVPTSSAMTLLPQRGQLVDISAFYGIGGNSILAYDEQAAGGELFNVMSTLTGDECFDPLFGCDLPRRVFEPVTARVEIQCISDVDDAAKWVQHITVDASQTTVFSSPDQRVVGVEVAYSFAGAGWVVGVPLSLALSGNV